MLRNNNIYYTLIFILVLPGMNSCLINGLEGEGNIITKEIKTSSFERIEQMSIARTDVYLNDTNAVLLTDFQNLIDYWDIKTSGNTLKIKTIPYTSFTKTSAKIIVKKTNNLSDVTLSGSGDLYIHNFFSSLNNYQLVGTGEIVQHEDVDLSALHLKISGSGDIQISGKTNRLNAESTGTGNMNTENLITKTADVKISGTGDIYLQVTDTLNVNITGTGNIHYSGNPVILKNITGTGKLIKE